MTKAVFFDAAGTLFEANEPVGHTYARIAREHGVRADDDAVSRGFRRAFSRARGLAFGRVESAAELRILEYGYWRRLVRESFTGLGPFADFDGFFDQLFAYFADPRHWKPVAGAHEVLGHLRARGLRLGVISNFDHRLYRILEGLGLCRYFESVTISSEVGFAKPAKEIFFAALDGAGVEASQTVHVGDSEHLDWSAALAAGLAAILIDPRQEGAQAARLRGARVGSLAAVPAALQRLNGD